MKYKVGDKVLVRTDLIVGKAYCYGVLFVKEMAKFVGKVVTIKKVEHQRYWLEEDPEKWAWVDDMFDGLAEKTPTNFKVGDKVRVKSDLIAYKHKYYMSDRKEYWYVYDNMLSFCGKVVTISNFDENDNAYEIEEYDDEDYWADEMFEGLAEEVKQPEPIQVNVTVNVNINYDNACWYCRKGGLVDLYFNGHLGICPHCGRVCNSTEQMTKSHKPDKPVKKENKPLTN